MKSVRSVVLVVAATLLPCAARAAEPPAQATAFPKLTVVTTSAHCDWSWGHSRAWHEDRYAEILHNVLLLMRQHPNYVWQLENENEELAPFLKKAAKEWPGLIEEFWQRVREGRIEVIVAISDPRVAEVYPETFVRNLVLGKEYFRRHAPGLRQEVYHAVDLMCGHSQVPQILAKADYRYFVFSRPCQKKSVFWRKGLDGTRMLCAGQHYGYEGIEVKGLRLRSVSGDDILPDPALAQAAETWDRGTQVLSTSARYFKELEKRGGPETELEGVLDSLECPCEGIVHGNRNLYSLNNQNEDRLLSAEKAQAMAAWATGRTFPKAAMDEAWHGLLSCIGHAILYCWKGDYEERLAQADKTKADAERALHDALAEATRTIRFRSGLGSPLVVFNFHAWPCTGPVEFPLPGGGQGLRLRDAAGHDVPLQVLEEPQAAGDRVAFIAEDVPACGYKTFYLQKGDAIGPARPARRAGLGPVANGLYRARMLPEGQLEVHDLRRGATLGSPQEGGLGDLVYYDAPQPQEWMLNGPLGPRHAWKPQEGEFQVVEGPVYSSLFAKGTFGPHRATREARFWRGARRIEYLVQIDAADGCGVFSIRFPTGLSGRVFAGIPFGAEPRENFDREPFRGEYFVQGYPDAYYATRWTDVSTADFGYTFVAPHGMPTGYFYKAADKALEFMLLRVRPMPGGVWGQVHPSMQSTGRHAWRCALTPHPGTWREAASYRDALELHVPLRAFLPNSAALETPSGEAPSQAGQPGDASSFAEVSPASVVLSSLRSMEPADGKTPTWEVRLYETIGQPADVTLRLSRCPAVVEETNLLGEPSHELGKIAVDGNKVRFRIPPWKIVVLRVR